MEVTYGSPDRALNGAPAPSQPYARWDFPIWYPVMYPAV